jgi:uncharacterized protein YndB with AHSA1/START domain
VPKPQHVHVVYIRTSPERLWQALTDPELTKDYYYGSSVVSTWEAGAPYAYRTDAGDAIVGEVLESVPPRRLVMTFTMAYDPEAAAEPPSRVTWEIEPHGEVCRLEVTHADFGGRSKTWSNTLDGWPPILSGLKTLLETGSPLGPIEEAGGESAGATDLDGEWHRDLGVDANMEVWQLLGRTDRSVDDDDAMLRAAYASAYHWARAAGRTTAHEARAEWLLSHVHAVLGQADLARHHAARSMAAVASAGASSGVADFDRAYAHEALARAAACAGRLDEAAAERTAAAAVVIADDEDRKIFLADLEAEPWFGLPAPPSS